MPILVPIIFTPAQCPVWIMQLELGLAGAPGHFAHEAHNLFWIWGVERATMFDTHQPAQAAAKSDGQLVAEAAVSVCGSLG